jgi:hypothetical protein
MNSSRARKSGRTAGFNLALGDETMRKVAHKIITTIP